jgi:DNA (cytosine-5)-methyltransferase 1
LWVVENVIPYYKPLLPAQRIGKHLLWSNFLIRPVSCNKTEHEFGNNQIWSKITGFDLSKFKLDVRKSQVYRNCVDSNLGLHILNSATEESKIKLFEM